ncbi:hypothetical protein FGO68_gene14355 [Halteria grandinella]|uniref:FAD-binding PCMH-type domain-containing protein n=1 Tax=Halteria grandinella TaxID=5974 RepID=A0A8J8T4S9_HALGN|nr:hypothetical protein FGO68_gene14355 [Halteria grandinella]
MSQAKLIALAAVVFLSCTQVTYAKTFCKPSNTTCWPNSTEIDALKQSLGPSINRQLKWTNSSQPRVTAVPINSASDQPLYGLSQNASLDPVYVRSQVDLGNTCFQPDASRYISTFCLASVRNYPYEGWTPAFVVWPVNASQVQIAVKFARKHNLCISVAGTGHDFLNRHSCADGVLIRTALLKDAVWDLTDTKGFGNADGNVKFGAGLVFSEVHKSAADNNRYVSSGWATTVGIIGWSIGGGHGPFSPGKGLGVDNILEVDIVLNSGELVTANSMQNSDLWWAIRGGGGSNWGVITAITIKAYKIPTGGFSFWQASWQGTFCNASLSQLDSFVDIYQNWTLTLNNQFGGLTFISPSFTNKTSDCLGTWSIYMSYVFQGPSTNANLTQFTTALTNAIKPTTSSTTSYANWWLLVQNKALEPIWPFAYLTPSSDYIGGLPSVLVSREVMSNGKWAAYAKARIRECLTRKNDNGCTRHEMYQDITGNVGSPQDQQVSISEGFRSAIVHYLVAYQDSTQIKALYSLGNNSYFSESAYTMDGFAERYWGSNYQRLQEIKAKYDPESDFACTHCVIGATASSDGITQFASYYLVLTLMSILISLF